MKRKRNQIDDSSNNNEGKKFRAIAEEEDYSYQQTDYNEADSSFERKKEEFVLTREIAESEVLTDITGTKWRVGEPIGKGSFGEIFLASRNIHRPVDVKHAQYVTKIEPHSNGPLFVEIHCLLNVNKRMSEADGDDVVNDNSFSGLPENSGIPKYIASGSHYFTDSRYRFLIMPRYKTDLHSIIKSGRLSHKHFLIVASQTIDVLMHLHARHYVHSDIKAENIMIGSCKMSDSENESNESKIPSIEFGGSNPLRNCRAKNPRTTFQSSSSFYNDMVRSHYLRPSRSILYSDANENSRSSHTPESDHNTDDGSENDEDFRLSPRKPKARKNQSKGRKKRNDSKSPVKCAGKLFSNKLMDPPPPPLQVDDDSRDCSDTDDRVFIIDYGLATKFVNSNNEHKPFCCDERRAHDGTLEFTSRDAHFGAHSRRSDLECLGYNLIYWSQGFLPWKHEKLKEQPEIVHRLKEVFMTDVKEIMKLLYGKDVPKYLGEFMQYVAQLEFDEKPDYAYLRGLFEKEFIKLGLNTSKMMLKISEMRDECEPIDKTHSENDLMMATISDTKTAGKLGFLIATDCVDGGEAQLKVSEANNLNASSKASPKNLRSKEKGKGKRPKRTKITEKELVVEKLAQGKKLSMAEIAVLDPEQIARDRADREYEKFDEKINCQTPQKYMGNPTYAILEIENRLKNRHSGAALAPPAEIDSIKGYTKSMMDVLKKQQMTVEQQFTPAGSQQSVKRCREGLRNVIKPTMKTKGFPYKKGRKTRRARNNNFLVKAKTLEVEADENEVPMAEEIEIGLVEVPEPQLQVPRRKRGRPRKGTKKIQPAKEPANELVEAAYDIGEITEAPPQPIKRGRGRPKIIKVVSEPLPIEVEEEEEEEEIEEEEEEASVYYDIPGEGSNDGIKEVSEDENQPEIAPQKRIKSRTVSPPDDNSNHESAASASHANHKQRSRYYADDDYDASTDESSNISSASHFTRSSASENKPLRARTVIQDRGITTRNKIKSRSTSRSAPTVHDEESEPSECSDIADNDSEYQVQSGEESAEEVEDQAMDYDRSETEEEEEEIDEDEGSDESGLADSNDSNDSIDIKYSPIKTRHARRRVNHFNVKQIRARRLSIDENTHNFRLVSTQG